MDGAQSKILLGNLVPPDCEVDLKSLSQRIMRKDRDAVTELSYALQKPGCVTIHQFCTEVLPAIHTSLVDSSPPTTVAPLSKKARVVGDSAGDVNVGVALCPKRDQDEKLALAKEMAKVLVLEPLLGKILQSAEESREAGLSNRPDVDLNDEHQEGGGDTDESSHDDLPLSKLKEDEKRDPYSYVEGSEAIRRLHQLLAFYENVPVVQSSSSKEGSSGDLQSLTKSIEVHLLPSAFNGLQCTTAGTKLSFYAQPLLPISELQRHILRACPLREQSYIAFCRR